MINKALQTIALVFIGLIASPALAHTGFHNRVYHPLSGVDHFIVILIVGLLAVVSGYYFYKK